MKKFRLLSLVLITSAALAAGGAHEAPAAHTASAASAHAAPVLPTPEQAMKKLTDGNRRFVSGRVSTMHSSAAARRALVKGQSPFAIIIGCSDSRVPPELIFDQGLGALFVIRTAGQVLDAPCYGSLEYAAEHLGTRLIVVLGHESCGAVKATLAGGEAPGHIAALVAAIKPSVDAARGQSGDLLHNAIAENVRRLVAQIEGSQPILAELVEKGQVKVVGAVYDLATGKVTFLDGSGGGRSAHHANPSSRGVTHD